jgi:hypothetical protein
LIRGNDLILWSHEPDAALWPGSWIAVYGAYFW